MALVTSSFLTLAKEAGVLKSLTMFGAICCVRRRCFCAVWSAGESFGEVSVAVSVAEVPRFVDIQRLVRESLRPLGKRAWTSVLNCARLRQTPI